MQNQEHLRKIRFELEPAMRRIPNADRRLDYISRAMNRIRKASTAEEITEMLNSDLGPSDRPFQTGEVAAWLRNAEDTVSPLYWLRTRPRR